MLRRCYFCSNEFVGNSAIEAFPGAKRIAYDPARGRLWAVCPVCGRWSLVPIDTRWEIVETLERLVRDNVRLLARSDNIALFATGDAELIRVGPATLREEAWWRYTREVGQRRRRARHIVGRGRLTEAAVSLLLTGVPVWGIRRPEVWIDRARRKTFGPCLWQGRATCAKCGRSKQKIRLRDDVLVRTMTGTDRFLVGGYCTSCGKRDESRFAVPDVLAHQVLRRALVCVNFAGISAEKLDDAVRELEEADTAGAFASRLASMEINLKTLPAKSSMAFEIAVNEEHERVLLSLELDQLEEQWRREEEIAAIADGELTPGPDDPDTLKP